MELERSFRQRAISLTISNGCACPIKSYLSHNTMVHVGVISINACDCLDSWTIYIEVARCCGGGGAGVGWGYG